MLGRSVGLSEEKIAHLGDDPLPEGVYEAEEAAIVREIFERYATGRDSHRELADWLNARGRRGRRGRPFSKDSVREILANATYAGYVSGRAHSRVVAIEVNTASLNRW